MNIKLLKNPDLQEIMEDFANFLEITNGSEKFKSYLLYKEIDLKNKNKEREQKLIEFAEILRNLLPNEKTHPSEKNIRSNIKDVTKSLDWFFKTYKKVYKTKEIMKAVERYGENAEKKNFQYISPLNYFIRKNNNSGLADMCETLRGENEPETTISHSNPFFV